MFDLFPKPKPKPKPLPTRQPQYRFDRNFWDVCGDGTFQVYSVGSDDIRVALFGFSVPFPPPGKSYSFAKANLILFEKDGWYTFRKDRSGGLYLEGLIEAGLVRRSQVIVNDMDKQTCCPLSEAALRMLSLMV